MRVLLAILISISALQAHAADAVAAYSSEDQKLEAVLSFVFSNESLRHGWPANYQTLWCPTNIFNLLKRLDQAHVDLSRAHVWYIVSPNAAIGGGDSDIYPRAARGGATSWSFHVVLEIEGRILDLDFTDQPQVTSVRSYALTMWGKSAIPGGELLYVRQIPALEYLHEYANNWEDYLNGLGGRYAAVEMSVLLARAAARP